MIPKPIYELLPFLYILVGVLTVIAIDSPLAFFSGIVFALAGVLVMKLRMNYRAGYTRQ